MPKCKYCDEVPYVTYCPSYYAHVSSCAAAAKKVDSYYKRIVSQRDAQIESQRQKIIEANQKIETLSSQLEGRELELAMALSRIQDLEEKLDHVLKTIGLMQDLSSKTDPEIIVVKKNRNRRQRRHQSRGRDYSRSNVRYDRQKHQQYN